MPFKLALKNIKSRPLRTTATIFVIAIAVSLLFCMFSFSQAVYEYIYATETADCGNSDVLVRTNSTSGRIINSDGFNEISGVNDVIATLSMYALYDGEYVRLRGFDKDDYCDLQSINVLQGDLSLLDKNIDNVVISKAFQDKYSVKIGDALSLKNGNSVKVFYVCAVAENDGYFLNAQPYTIVGRVEGVARLLSGEFAIYNEIYLKTESKDAVINTLKNSTQYQKYTIGLAEDIDYISTQAQSLSAPVVIAGLGVIILAIACISLISLTTVADRRKYISKLTVIGATRQQIIAIFLVEVLIVAFIGAIVGSILAGGVFALLVKVVLSSMISFSISGLKLFGASVLGFVVAVFSVIIPMISAFRSSVRENETASSQKNVVKIAFPIALTLATIVSIIVEHTVDKAVGSLSIVNVILVIATIVVIIPYIYRAIASCLAHTNEAHIKLVGKFNARSKRHSNLQMLTAGMTVVMLLFMAWSLTTDMFTSYLSEFDDKIFVTNVSSDILSSPTVDGLTEIEGVESATPMVWKQGSVDVDKEKTINILGSADVLELIDFEYVTDESIVRENVNTLGYVVIDKAYSVLYGVQLGDDLTFDIDGHIATLKVGGITSHKLFSGNYAIISLDTINACFGIGADTVIVVADNPEIVSQRIREVYSEKNYYAVEALTMYKWDAESMSAVFDLVGTLAIILIILTFMVLVFSSVVSFSSGNRNRTAMLSAGMSKNKLLCMEIGENLFAAIISYIISFASSVLLTSSLIGALRLFDLYFEFMYNAGIVALVGGALVVGYTIIPLLLGYRRKYNMQRKY